MAPPAFAKAVAYGVYQDKLRAAVHALKYDGATTAAVKLSQMLARAIGKLAEEAPQSMLVLPVPLSRSRYAQRGFNQSELLAEHAIKALRKSHPDWKLTLARGSLVRRRDTESQAALTTRKRRLNVRGAFLVPDPHTVTGRHVLLIDDILTTGATARAASKALIDAGAAGVCVASLARARMIFGRPGSSDIYQGFSTESDSRTHAVKSFQLPGMHSSINQPSF